MPPVSFQGGRSVLDNQVWMQVDADKDGIFEQKVGPHSLTSTLGSGLVGMNSFGSTEMDNFKFFDAVLWEKTGVAPTVGSPYTMELRAPAPGVVPKPYLCLASFSNKGIPFGPVTIPLYPDLLFNLSVQMPGVFANFTGLLDKNGAASPTFNIPKVAALIGADIYIAGIVLDTVNPFPIAHVSNDLHLKIQ